MLDYSYTNILMFVCTLTTVVNGLKLLTGKDMSVPSERVHEGAVG